MPAAADPLFLAFQAALTGRYSIVRELGRGGMGVVYLAHEVHLDRLVAIKLLPPDKAERPALRERFVREARLAGKLSHPHVVPIYAVDDLGGFVFYVMAYVDGETLGSRVQQRGPLSTTDGVRMLREVAWALAYAHAQGVVHRDIKPDNILIETVTGRALVVDFGIAAIAGDETEGGLAGTPEFMSPEQALSGTIDARSDLYALGASAFYAFSGRVPFEGQSSTEVLARQIAEVPPSLASLGLAVPRTLGSLIARCLAKDPADRPASAERLAEQLAATAVQRRELPPALRAFVRRTGRIDGGRTLFYGTGALAVSIVAASLGGTSAGFITLAAAIAAGPALFGVAAARRLIKLGFTRDDLPPAFQRELEDSREERAAEHVQSRRFERMVGAIARISASFSVVAVPVIAGAALIRAAGAAAALPAAAATIGTALVSGAVYLALVQRRRDIDTEFWSALWTGRVGGLLFNAARAMRGTQHTAAAMTHRATELSLGLAAEDLYASLPKATRRELGDVPALLRRLQQDAQRLRARYEDLSGVVGADQNTEDNVPIDLLREERDAVHEKLTEAVGALESIRLNLLRLHAGSVTIDGFTTHIGLAEDVSAEVERMIAAREEVQAVLRFPHAIEPTPV